MGEDFNQKKVLELKEEWTNTNILLELLVMWRQLKEMKLIPPKEVNRCLELKDTAGYDRMKGLSSLEKNAPEVEDNFDGGTPDCIDCMISAPIEVDLVQQCFVLHELCEKEIEVYSHVPVKDVTVEDLYKSDSSAQLFQVKAVPGTRNAGEVKGGHTNGNLAFVELLQKCAFNAERAGAVSDSYTEMNISPDIYAMHRHKNGECSSLSYKDTINGKALSSSRGCNFSRHTRQVISSAKARDPVLTFDSDIYVESEYARVYKTTSKQRAMQDKLDQKQGHDFQEIGINLDHKDFKWEISASPKAKTKAKRGTVGGTQHTEFQSTLNEPSTEGSMGGTRSTDCQSMFHDSSLKCQQDGGFRCRNDDGTVHNSSQCDSLSQ